jgi:hypothetical protein
LRTHDNSRPQADGESIRAGRAVAGCILVGYSAVTFLGLLLAGAVGAVGGANIIWIALPVGAALIGTAVLFGLPLSTLAAVAFLIPMLVTAALSFGSAQGAELVLAALLLAFPIMLAGSLLVLIVRRRHPPL